MASKSSLQDLALEKKKNWTTYVDSTSEANTIYVGLAEPTSTTSDAAWQIQKVDTSSGVTITWANGDDSFTNIWDERTSYTYS
jgi:hypothetical protein